MKALMFRGIIAAVLMLFVATPALQADTVKMKNGDFFEGVIKMIEDGEVLIEINKQMMTFDILKVDSINFDTPHLVSTGTDVAMDHFLSDMEAQEVVESFAELEETASELRTLMTQIEGYWEAKQPIESDETAAWNAARDRFRRPLSRYQELLNDLYFHVLARVDEYNAFAHDAADLYVGVKGIFKVGSPLLTDEMKPLALRKYVPGSWYDTIFYDGYNIGYSEAFEKIQGETSGYNPNF